MTEEALFLIGDLIMGTAIMGVLVFVVSYLVFFDWRKTKAGKSLLYFSGALALWALQSLAARLDPEYPFRAWSRVFVYLLIAVTIWGLVITLWRSWNKPLEVEPRKKEQDVE